VLLVGGGSPAVSGELALLDLDGIVLAQRRIADDLVYAVDLAPRAELAAAACADGAVQLLRLPDLASERTVWRHEGPAVAVAFAPDGELLASAGHDGKLFVGAVATGSKPKALLDHTAAVTCLAWSADGALLASGARDGKVRLHERAGRLLHTWQRLGGVITRVAFAAGRLECGIDGAPGVPPRVRSLPLP
jgi:WD40 repeat protein